VKYNHNLKELFSIKMSIIPVIKDEFTALSSVSHDPS